MKVLKFGGTSVGSEKGLSQVKKIVESCSEDVIVVVSALGGITDQLLLTARLAAAGDEAYMPQCTAMIARHNELVEKIVLPENRPGVQNRLDELLDELYDHLTKKIEAAIAGLTYKDADYSKVDAAVKKIPNDLKKYTDESVKAVNDAKAAIVRGKNITEQKTVDGYAAALEKAIAGLKQKPMTAQNLPKITKGVNQSGMQGKELSFTADFEAKDLKKVLIDQKEIDAKNYVTAGKENTQVTLKAEYTKSLAEGKHTISIVSSKGQADTVFYLKKATKSPDTGDRTQVMLWVILLGVSAAAVVGAVVYRKREK